MDKKLREEILKHAHEILNDEILLSALIEAGDKNLSSKIVDLRSIAMQKMDGELKKLKRSNQIYDIQDAKIEDGGSVLFIYI